MHTLTHTLRSGIFWCLSLLALLVVACKPTQKTVTYTPEQIVPTDNSLLWRISGNGLKKPSYLFGTIHMIPKEDLKFSDATLGALDRTERVAYEIDMKEMTNLRTQFSLMTKAFMRDGLTLKKILPTEDYQLIRAKMEEKGMASPMFERMKPMFLSMVLNTDAEEGGGLMGGGNSKMTSVEMELHRLAKKRKMKSAGLESVDYQMSVFDSIPYTAQAKMLVESLRASAADTTGGDELEKMIQMYKQEDITAMQQMIGAEEGGMGEYEDILLGRRNRNWIPIMSNMMLNQPTFFAVGAGHLGGPGGVVALLRKAGYQVEALK